jgi:predicted PurR-regulated permease PerM
VSLRALLVLGGVVAALLVVSRLKVVLIPIAVALLLTAPLRPVAARLERRIGRSAAAILCVAGLVVVVVGTIGAAGTAVASDAGELRTAFSELVDDVEAWLVDRGVERATIDDVRADLAARGPSLLRGAASGAVVAAEVLAGLLLALILSIFLLRDGDAFVEALARRSPPRRAARIRLGADASWTALRRYLLGAALLGTIEAVIIGSTVAIVGSPLAVPVAAFTFLAAFVPIVGAVAAGVVAIAAALVGGGAAAALVVGAVAVVVQQLDGDLLAPLIYGRATKLHPAAVLVAIATGTALGGLAGAVLAVPLLTVAVTVARATGDDEVDAEVRGPQAARVATDG